MSRRVLVLATLLTAAACAGGPPRPAPLDTANDACAWCRMVVSDGRFAAQLVAPGEEARFFDDIGCLSAYLNGGGAVPRFAVAFVADHRTRGFVPAASAVYTRVDRLPTPMDSHVIAHESEASRDADPDARGGVPIAASTIFGPAGLPRAFR